MTNEEILKRFEETGWHIDGEINPVEEFFNDLENISGMLEYYLENSDIVDDMLAKDQKAVARVDLDSISNVARLLCEALEPII